MSEHRPLVRMGSDEVPPSLCRGGAVTVGNFDGVHLGHASLVRRLCESAATVGGPAVVLTFDPHPLALLAPEKFQPMLNTPGDRVRFLQELGATDVVLLQTSWNLLHLTPDLFFEKIVRDGFAAKSLVEGFNFHFGRDRAGDTTRLAELCRTAAIAFTVVPPFELDGIPVSSSRIRMALLAGDVIEAARLMNRPYNIRGIVGTGMKRGRTLGFPTANLERVETLLPADGVYAVRVRWDEKWWAGAANIGPNPTFGEKARKIEVHLIDFQGDLYGAMLNVEFVARLRGTRPFSGPVELIEQLQRDVADSRLRLSGNDSPRRRSDGEPP
jgi:riboflavin kinase/FMN adenylyltransferase